MLCVLSNRRICVIGPDKLIFREFVDMMLHDQMDVTGHKRTNKDTSRHKWIEVCAWTLTNFYFHTQPFDKMLKQSIWITTTVSPFSLVLQSTVHCIHISHMSECTYVPDVLVVTLVAWISLNYSVVETCFHEPDLQKCRIHMTYVLCDCSHCQGLMCLVRALWL